MTKSRSDHAESPVTDHFVDTSKTDLNVSESTSDKLSREAQLVWQGTASGVAESFAAAKQNPVDSAVRVGIGAAMTVAIAAASDALGPGSLLMKSAGAAFIANAAYHFGSNAIELSSSFADCWKSGANFDADKKKVSDAVGPLVMDTALMATGSLAGSGFRLASDIRRTARYGDVPVFGESTLRRMDDKTAETITESRDSTVLAFRELATGRLGGHGSGFIIDKSGLVATAAHNLEGHEKFQVGVPGRGLYPAKVVGFSAEHDTALLKIEPLQGEELPVAKLAQNEPSKSDSLVALGYPNGHHYKGSVGKYIKSVDGVKLTQDGEFQIYKGKGSYYGGLATASVDGGMSGGPVYNSANEVVGLINSKVGAKSQFASVRHIRELLDQLPTA